jgi:hypothetical protein
MKMARGQAQWLTRAFSVTREVEIQSITIQGQPKQKVSETPISINKPGMVAYACHPSWKGGIRRRNAV